METETNGRAYLYVRRIKGGVDEDVEAEGNKC